jgi:hypothetical protein
LSKLIDQKDKIDSKLYTSALAIKDSLDKKLKTMQPDHGQKDDDSSKLRAVSHQDRERSESKRKTKEKEKEETKTPLTGRTVISSKQDHADREPEATSSRDRGGPRDREQQDY